MKYKRLKFLANQINKGESVLDVGTDHGLLPIFLVQEDVTDKVVASDVNEEPLKAAEFNLKENSLEDKIELRLMNGIIDIKEDEFNTIVIAGMGGITISEIIKSKSFNGRYLIHSTTNLEEVRKSLEDISYEITNEWVVYEGKVHNVIIEAKPGIYKMDEKELFMGPKLISNDHEEVTNYYNHLYNVFERNAQLSKNDKLKINERNWLKEKLWNE